MKSFVSFLSFNVLAASLSLVALHSSAQENAVKKNETKVKIITIENGTRKVKEITLDANASQEEINNLLKAEGIGDVELPPLPPLPPNGVDAPDNADMPPPPPHMKRRIMIIKKSEKGDSTFSSEKDITVDFWDEDGDTDGHRKHGRRHHRKHGRHGHHDTDSLHEVRHIRMSHCKGDSIKCEQKVVIIKKDTKKSARKTKTNNASLQVYPNPSNGQFTVKYPAVKEAGEITLQITDVKGREIRNEKMTVAAGSFEQVINLGSEVKGTYIVTITGKNLKKSETIIIQ